MLRFILGLFAALIFSGSAHAVIPAVPGFNYGLVGLGPTATSLEAWIAAWVAPRNLTWQSCDEPWSNNTTICRFTHNTSGNPSTAQVQRFPAGLRCPANATLSGSDCICNTGYSENIAGNACVASNAECQVGQGRTFNRTEGWARSAKADANDVVADLGPLSSVYDYNDGACVGNITGVERCWRSQEPSVQGLYRISCDYNMVVTSAATSPGDPTADPSEPPVSCPGFVGQVNGKAVCVGTASSPLPSGTDAPNEPTSAGNPSAGGKPASGPGSGSDGAGRTPSTGSGGNDGGPASAAVGRGGTGQRGDGTESTGEVCGAAPLPPCNVKVDETGVPAEGTAEGRFSQAGTDLDQVKTDAQGAFEDHKSIALPDWTWTFQFPTGCTPLVLPAFDDFEIDVCQFQPIIHDLMSVLWVIAGIWGLIALFQRATGT